jgi:hypothetical protein
MPKPSDEEIKAKQEAAKAAKEEAKLSTPDLDEILKDTVAARTEMHNDPKPAEPEKPSIKGPAPKSDVTKLREFAESLMNPKSNGKDGEKKDEKEPELHELLLKHIIESQMKFFIAMLKVLENNQALKEDQINLQSDKRAFTTQSMDAIKEETKEQDKVLEEANLGELFALPNSQSADTADAAKKEMDNSVVPESTAPKPEPEPGFDMCDDEKEAPSVH